MRIILTILTFSLFHSLSIAVALESLEDDNSEITENLESEMFKADSPAYIRSKRHARDITGQSPDVIGSIFHMFKSGMDTAQQATLKAVHVVGNVVEGGLDIAKEVGKGMRKVAEEGVQTVGGVVKTLPFGESEDTGSASLEAPPSPEAGPARK